MNTSLFTSIIPIIADISALAAANGLNLANEEQIVEDAASLYLSVTKSKVDPAVVKAFIVAGFNLYAAIEAAK